MGFGTSFPNKGREYNINYKVLINGALSAYVRKWEWDRRKKILFELYFTIFTQVTQRKSKKKVEKNARARTEIGCDVIAAAGQSKGKKGRNRISNIVSTFVVFLGILVLLRPFSSAAAACSACGP